MKALESITKRVSGNCLLRFGLFAYWISDAWNYHVSHRNPQMSSTWGHRSSPPCFATGSGEKGFTLIEMLVAMAIFSALIMVLMTGYRQGLMMWDKGQQMSRSWLDMEFRYRLLDTLFAQAVVADDEFTRKQSAPYFDGDASTLRMLSAAPLMDNSGRIRPVMLQLTVRPDRRLDLRYQEGLLHSDQRRGIRWSGHWAVLLEGLSRASFSYELPENPLPDVLIGVQLSEAEQKAYRDKPEWLPSCQSRDLLVYPRRIVLRFTDSDDVAHQWFFRPPDTSDAWIMGE